MNRRNRRSKNRLPESFYGSDLNLVAYTPESIRKTFGPDGGMAEDLDRMYYGDIDGFVNEMLCRLYGEDYPDLGLPDFKIKIGVIDDEYYSWLDGRDDTSENRTKYSMQLSEEDATRLMRKNRKDYSLSLYGLPFTVLFPDGVGKKTEFKLDKETRRKIERCIRKNTTEDAVIYVTDYILKPDVFVRESEKIFEAGFASIRDKKDIICSRYYTQEYSDARVNLVRFYIPVIIGTHEKSAVIDAEKFINGSYMSDKTTLPELIIFSRDPDFDYDDMYKCTESFEEAGITDAVKDIMTAGGAGEDGVKLDPILTPVEGVEEAEGELMKMLKKKGRGVFKFL